MHIVLEILILICRIILSYFEAFIRLFYNPQKDIAGRVAVLTGASGGIGRCVALVLLQKNVRLALWDVNKKAVDSLCQELRERGHNNVYAYQCDITHKTEVKRAADETRRDLGEVDLLFNNAGVLKGKDILDLTEADIRQTFEVNAISHFWTVQEFLPHMIEKNYGHIINTASMAGKVGTAWLTDYCASKHAVVGMSDSLRLDLRRRGSDVKVSTVCPFFVNTNLLSNSEVTASCTPYTRFDKFMEPEDVALAIIDGMLRNTTTIYVPKKMATSLFIGGLMPEKAGLLGLEFSKSGFFPKDAKLD